jgi:hypothetical protein
MQASQCIGTALCDARLPLSTVDMCSGLISIKVDRLILDVLEAA